MVTIVVHLGFCVPLGVAPGFLDKASATAWELLIEDVLRSSGTVCVTVVPWTSPQGSFCTRCLRVRGACSLFNYKRFPPDGAQDELDGSRRP